MKREKEQVLESILADYFHGIVVSALNDPFVQKVVRDVVREELRELITTEMRRGALRPTISVSEAARFAGVTDATVRDWIGQKKLLALRAGNRYRIKREDLERCMTDYDTRQAISLEEEATRIIRVTRQKSSKGKI